MSGRVTMVNAYRFRNGVISILIVRKMLPMNVIAIVSFQFAFWHTNHAYAVWYVLHDELFGWCMKKERVFSNGIGRSTIFATYYFSFNFKYAGLSVNLNKISYITEGKFRIVIFWHAFFFIQEFKLQHHHFYFIKKNYTKIYCTTREQ